MHIILFVLMALSYVIVCDIELQWYLPFESSKAEEINNLISATLGAFASGILIYFITSWLPDWLERRKLKEKLDEGIENVNVLLADMIPGFSAIIIDGRKKVINIDECIKRISQVKWNDESEESKVKEILENFRFLKAHILHFLQVFQKHLSMEQINWLHEISNSAFEQLITPGICPHGNVNQRIIDEYEAILKCNEKLQKSAGYPSSQEMIHISGSRQ